MQSSKPDSGCSSPLRRNPGRQSRASASNTPMSSQNNHSGETPGGHADVIESGSSNKGGAKGKSFASIEVAVPIKQLFPYEDSSSSGTQSRSGFDTPATSITTTPAESDTISKRPRRRVNASTRALELRTSSYSLNNASSSKKRGIDEISNQDVTTENSDARLARALQAEEYAESHVKRAKFSKSNISGVHNSTDDEDDDLLVDMGWTATDYEATSSRNISTASKGKGKMVIPDSDASSLSELDLESAEMEDAAAEIEDSEMEDEEYEDSAADDKSEASEDEIPAPVAEAPPRPSARSRQRTRPSRRDRKTSSSPDMSPSISRLTGRVRPHSHSPTHSSSKLTGSQARKERKKLEKQHPSVKTMWKELKDIPVITPTPAAQPPDISRTLKSFQLEGLDWMIKQEKSQWKGGLLGDEMGMGKTIQAVSLLMSDYPVGKPSLVVVPPVALMQWQSEIKVGSSFVEGPNSHDSY